MSEAVRPVVHEMGPSAFTDKQIRCSQPHELERTCPIRRAQGCVNGTLNAGILLLRANFLSPGWLSKKRLFGRKRHSSGCRSDGQSCGRPSSPLGSLVRLPLYPKEDLHSTFPRTLVYTVHRENPNFAEIAPECGSFLRAFHYVRITACEYGAKAPCKPKVFVLRTRSAATTILTSSASEIR